MLLIKVGKYVYTFIVFAQPSLLFFALPKSRKTGSVLRAVFSLAFKCYVHILFSFKNKYTAHILQEASQSLSPCHNKFDFL